MNPTNTFWQNIPGHTGAGYRTPPASWTSCLFGLIGDQTVEHSHNAVVPFAEGDEWRGVFLTVDRIAYMRAVYPRGVEQAEEDRIHQSWAPLEIGGWVREISSISSLSFASATGGLTQKDERYLCPNYSVSFPDGTSVNIPFEADAHSSSREQCEKLVAAIRDRALTS